MSKRSYLIALIVFVVLVVAAVAMRGDGGLLTDFLVDLHGGR